MLREYVIESTKQPPCIISEEDCNTTILLVDDEIEVREILKEYFELLGYSVLPAASFKDAMNLFTKNEKAINLLVSDLSLQGLSGIELAKVLITMNPKLNVLLMSGNLQWFHEEMGMMQSGVDFIEKPFDFNVMKEKLRRLIGDS